MGEYIKPFRRKIGIVALLITLAFTFGWMRSKSEIDFIGIRLWGQIYSCGSFRGVLHLDACTPASAAPPFLTWGAMHQSDYDQSFHGDDGGKADVWFYPEREKSDWFGKVYFGAIQERTVRTEVSYWYIVILQTVITSWLLLSKRFRRTSSGKTMNVEAQ